MGYDGENAQRVIFDIETAPLHDAADYLEPAEAPANYKDPIKIADYIAAKHAENVDRCGLDVDLCRVVAIGWQVEGRHACALTASSPETEAALINEFWNIVGPRHLVGFNCLKFDLPVLIRRAQYLGAYVPSVQIDKYRHPSVTDLQMVLSFNGAINFRGLRFYAKRFGIPVTDATTGADIARLVQVEDWPAVIAHVQSDVTTTAALAAKLGLFAQVPQEAMTL